jgi:hypothetical protein
VTVAVQVGTFLASQADDRSVIVWRVSDWAPVARISKPFERWMTLTFSLRCQTATRRRSSCGAWPCLCIH